MPDDIETRLAELRDAKKRYRVLKKSADEAKAMHDGLERAMFDELMERRIPSIGHDGAKYVRKSTIFAVMQDRDAFIAWCNERDLHDEFVRETEEKARLNEYVRAAIDNGEDLPAGVHWYSKDYIAITEN